MDKIKVSAERVIETVRAVVAERPEYVYKAPDELRGENTPSCLYVHGDEPGCVVGVALNRLGVPLDELKRFEGNGAYTVADSILDTTEHAARFLDFLQDRQDSGNSWGVALAQAESML